MKVLTGMRLLVLAVSLIPLASCVSMNIIGPAGVMSGSSVPLDITFSNQLTEHQPETVLVMVEYPEGWTFESATAEVSGEAATVTPSESVSALPPWAQNCSGGFGTASPRHKRRYFVVDPDGGAMDPGFVGTLHVTFDTPEVPDAVYHATAALAFEPATTESVCVPFFAAHRVTVGSPAFVTFDMSTRFNSNGVTAFGFAGAVGALESYLLSPESYVEDLKWFIEICDVVPDNVKDLCINFVYNHLDYTFEYVREEWPPTAVVQMVGCDSGAGDLMEEQCAMMGLKDYLLKEDKVLAIRAWAFGICEEVPVVYQDLCREFLFHKVDEAHAMIEYGIVPVYSATTTPFPLYPPGWLPSIPIPSGNENGDNVWMPTETDPRMSLDVPPARYGELLLYVTRGMDLNNPTTVFRPMRVTLTYADETTETVDVGFLPLGRLYSPSAFSPRDRYFSMSSDSVGWPIPMPGYAVLSPAVQGGVLGGAISAAVVSPDTTKVLRNVTVELETVQNPPAGDTLALWAITGSAIPVNNISGGAYFYPESPTYRATFSLDVTGRSSPSGWLKYYYARRRMNFVSTSITSMTVSGDTATITGNGSVNGAGGYTFTATVADGSPDTFGIVINKPNGDLYYSAGPKNIAGGDFAIK